MNTEWHWTIWSRYGDSEQAVDKALDQDGGWTGSPLRMARFTSQEAAIQAAMQLRPYREGATWPKPMRYPFYDYELI